MDDPGNIIIILIKTPAVLGGGAKLNLKKYTFIKTSIKVTYYLCYIVTCCYGTCTWPLFVIILSNQ